MGNVQHLGLCDIEQTLHTRHDEVHVITDRPQKQQGSAASIEARRELDQSIRARKVDQKVGHLELLFIMVQ